MRASKEDYEKVAKNCSSYDRSTKAAYKNSASDVEGISCLNCSHFDENKYCKLDLYDKIKKNHNI